MQIAQVFRNWKTLLASILIISQKIKCNLLRPNAFNLSTVTGLIYFLNIMQYGTDKQLLHP